MADKIPSITESALSNNSARTVLTSILGPAATTFPHYHTHFSETFTLLSGSLTVNLSPDMNPASFVPKSLAIGESATVPPGALHNFLVGDEETTCTVTFEPGYLDFERAMLIMRGTQKDGIYQEFGKPDEHNLKFMAVLAELTNSNAVGDVKGMLGELYASKGEEIKALKKELLEKYASDEELKKGTD